ARARGGAALEDRDAGRREALGLPRSRKQGARAAQLRAELSGMVLSGRAALGVPRRSAAGGRSRVRGAGRGVEADVRGAEATGTARRGRCGSAAMKVLGEVARGGFGIV